MSELDLVKQDIQQISDDIESSRPEIYEESSLISKHQKQY